MESIHCLKKPENTYFVFQTSLFFMLALAAVINLSLRTGNLELWTMILTAVIGIVVPNPKLKSVKDNGTDTDAPQ